MTFVGAMHWRNWRWYRRVRDGPNFGGAWRPGAAFRIFCIIVVIVWRFVSVIWYISYSLHKAAIDGMIIWE